MGIDLKLAVANFQFRASPSHRGTDPAHRSPQTLNPSGQSPDTRSDDGDRAGNGEVCVVGDTKAAAQTCVEAGIAELLIKRDDLGERLGKSYPCLNLGQR